MKHIPDINILLEADASIVESVLFESALVKLHLNKFNDRSPEEKESTESLRKNIEVSDPLDTPNDKDLAEIAIVYQA